MMCIGFTIIQVHVFHLSGWVVLFSGAYCFLFVCIALRGSFFCLVGGGVFYLIIGGAFSLFWVGSTLSYDLMSFICLEIHLVHVSVYLLG